MKRIIDYNAVQPRSVVTPGAITIPRSPQNLRLASIRIHIGKQATRNRVELIGTVGLQGVRGISQVLFRLFRDGRQIYTAQQDVQSVRVFQTNFVTFQAIDRNVRAGNHVYTLTAENMAKSTRADVNGPLSFSGLAIRIK